VCAIKTRILTTANKWLSPIIELAWAILNCPPHRGRCRQQDRRNLSSARKPTQ